MGRKKISIDQLTAEVDKILEDYKDDVGECLDKVAVQYAKIGKAKLQETSPKRTGHYAKGWAWKRTGKAKSKGGDLVNVTVHNKTDYQLTHLLENGHAKRNGGRVPGIPHIAPVEEEIIEGFVDTVEKNLK